MKLIDKIKSTPIETKILFVVIIIAFIFYSTVI
jgi:hypothetical protein